MKTILLMGGETPERKVSLMSGEQILEALRRLGEDVVVMDPFVDKDWVNTIQTFSKPVQVFNILHGGSGENGQIRALLNYLDIPCTGSDFLPSSLAMNKSMSKHIWRSMGIPTPNWQRVTPNTTVESILQKLDLPVFVKPSCGGSSTHSHRIDDASLLAEAISDACCENGEALVEMLVEGLEYTLSVLDNKPLPLIHIATDNCFYDFDAKYVDPQTRFDCPASLSPENAMEWTHLSMRAYRALQCQGWGRVDFMIDKKQQPYVLEVNTIPGMTSHSLVPMAAKAVGIDFDTLVSTILYGGKK